MKINMKILYYMNLRLRIGFFCLLVCKVLFTAVLDNYRYIYDDTHIYIHTHIYI